MEVSRSKHYITVFIAVFRHFKGCVQPYLFIIFLFEAEHTALFGHGSFTYFLSVASAHLLSTPAGKAGFGKADQSLA